MNYSVATDTIQTFATATEQLLGEIPRPKFDPKYILARFGMQLEPLAFQIISSEKRPVLALWDLEQKIHELIRSDSSGMYQAHMAKFILESPYYYDSTRQMYQSGLSSVWENLLKISLYGFPGFLGTLNNEFKFNSVIYELVIRYAPKTMEIHKTISSTRPGYTFHSLTKEQLKSITKETYGIYCRVQQFLQSLTREQMDWIDLVQTYWSEGGARGTAFRVYEHCARTYKETYGSEPPQIDFDLVWKCYY